MDYKYNGNLSIVDKTNQVAKEITETYPEIPFNLAFKIASLEERISTPKDFKMQFNRLYKILLFTQNNKEIYTKVYNDIIKLYYSADENMITDLESYLMKEIELYTKNERTTFPITSEFYK